MLGWLPGMLGWIPGMLGWIPEMLGWSPGILGWLPGMLGHCEFTIIFWIFKYMIEVCIGSGAHDMKVTQLYIQM